MLSDLSLLTWKMIHHGWPEDPGGMASTFRALPQLSSFLVQTMGVPLFLFALIGIYARLVEPWRRRQVENYWAVMGALIIGFFIFHALLYHSIAELRYYVMIAPAMVLFVMAGVRHVLAAGFLQSFTPAVRVALVVICAAGSFAAFTFRIPSRASHGFNEAAQKLAATPQHSVILVSSNAYGEGMLIAELAAHEKRLSHIVVRATQQLSSSAWTGENYVLRYHKPEEVQTAMEQIPVNFVVVHTTRPDGSRSRTTAC